MNEQKTYWEKSHGWQGNCDLCDVNVAGKKSRRKFVSHATFEGDDADDEAQITLCEDCFIKTR